MSKKYGLDKFDKWDKQLNNWESSEYYYSQEEYENYADDINEEEEKEYESRKRKRFRC